MSEMDVPEERIQETTSWPDLAISLYDRLTGRGAEIIYDFEDMEVEFQAVLERMLTCTMAGRRHCRVHSRRE